MERRKGRSIRAVKMAINSLRFSKRHFTNTLSDPIV